MGKPITLGIIRQLEHEGHLVRMTSASPATVARIREVLAATYPGTRFSVRAQPRTAEVTISWSDGPTCGEVDAQVSAAIPAGPNLRLRRHNSQVPHRS